MDIEISPDDDGRGCWNILQRGRKWDNDVIDVWIGFEVNTDDRDVVEGNGDVVLIGWIQSAIELGVVVKMEAASYF